MTSQARLRGAADRSDEKRQAISAAAEAIFLRDGFAAANMDEIARQAGVSKQTIYAHFGTKRDLFVEIITRALDEMGRGGLELAPDEFSEDDLDDLFADYGERRLTTMLDSRVLQLQRLVTGECARFPELAALL